MPDTQPQLRMWFAGPGSCIPGMHAVIACGGFKEDLEPFNPQVTATLIDLPDWVSGYFIENITWYRTSSNRMNLATSFGFKLRLSDRAHMGQFSYTLQIEGKTKQGDAFKRFYPRTFTVRPRRSSTLSSSIMEPEPDITDARNQWSNRMVEYGQRLIDKGYIGCCGSYTGPWYYDGARAFWQCADYLAAQGDSARASAFEAFGHKIHAVYKDYVLNKGGCAKMYAVFPHGLRMAWERYILADAKDALNTCGGNTGGFGPRYHWGAGFTHDRDEAYGLSLHVNKHMVGWDQLGQARKDLGYEDGETYFHHCLANVMGHMDQWFITRNARYVYPFTVGLSAEALIDYYESPLIAVAPTWGEEVPAVLQDACDYMMDSPDTFHPPSESMFIVEEKDGVVTRGPAPDLNLMLCPLYAWVFRYTGQEKYRAFADLLFRSGVEKAYLGDGKHFVQNYRWSFKYLEWRKSAAQEPPPPPPPEPDTTLERLMRTSAKLTKARSILADAHGDIIGLIGDFTQE